MSLTSVDLPEPLTPVTAVSVPSGIATSMFLQVVRARAANDDLALRAPDAATRGVGIERSPRR